LLLLSHETRVEPALLVLLFLPGWRKGGGDYSARGCGDVKARLERLLQLEHRLVLWNELLM
jgi:hypothetical protein